MLLPFKKKSVIYYFLFILMHLVFALISTKAFSNIPKDNNGWSILIPTIESRIIYVSNAGDDSTGEIYSREIIGMDPSVPNDEKVIKTFKTFKAAFNKTRKNKPDWILIKRGDNFFESIDIKSGKEALAPFVISTYGENKENPIFNTGTQMALSSCCHTKQYVVVKGLTFYSHTRDPKSPSYSSSDGKVGLRIYVNENQIIKNILLEGNTFKFYPGNTIQGKGTFENLILRRNLFLDHYSTTSHSAGLYTSNVSLTLEENIFDHNGWLQQANKEKKIGKAQGAATMFNHNTYFTNAHNVNFINNIFLRGSSMHNKWTANNGIHSSSNVSIINNLYIDGEIGISAGGNKTGVYRFKNYKISNNVMLNIGLSQPTNRALSWGIEVNDWDGGLIENNYFIEQTSPSISNAYALSLNGTTKDVTITNNTVYNLMNANALILSTSDKNKSTTVKNNRLFLPSSGKAIINMRKNLTGYTFINNQYFHDNGTGTGTGTDDFFIKSKTNTQKSIWQKLLGAAKQTTTYSFIDWLEVSKEESSKWSKPQIKEHRNLNTYLISIGKVPSFEYFNQELRKQTIKHWDTRFTAKSINSYIKSGYENNN